MGFGGGEFRSVGVKERGDRIGRWSREVVGWLPALRAPAVSEEGVYEGDGCIFVDGGAAV